MEQKIKILINEALKNLGIAEANFTVEHPEDLKNGDYSTNVAMVLAKREKMNPKELAEKMVNELQKNSAQEIMKIEVAGAGFINFYLTREFFAESVKDILNKGDNWGKNEMLAGKKVMVEYTQPNPFKPFHIGHLMSNAIGESISRIVEFSGAKTVRANYQGDVGPHVAKAMYGMYKAGAPADESASASVIAQYIGECYAKGSDAYDNDPEAKKEIEAFNKKIYDRSDAMVNQIYDWGKKATLEAFEEIYALLGTKFDHYFFESVMAPIGEKIVRENLGKVFEESDPEGKSTSYGAGAAIIFRGEKYDPKLHTRVFINSQGLPTYETKEIGLTVTKFEKENPDISIVTTAVEQAEYMKVVAKALSLIHPEYESRMKHITHGMMRLASGKMSSRKGNVVTGESLLRDSMEMIQEKIKDRDFSDAQKKEVSEAVGVAALKYSILRSAMGSDIVFDFEKSISFEGDSGPYLQYSATRAKSVLAKAGAKKEISEVPETVSNLEKILYRFPEVVLHAYEELEPHHITTYLTALASEFNSFYGNTQIISEEKSSAYYLALTEAFLRRMQSGLHLLGIKMPERM